MKTVIVGGVAAGASTGARLRRLDESAEIVVLERDHYVSFANCGLPYHIGGAIPDRDSLLLQTPESLARALALEVRTGQDVLRIDRDAKEVQVRDLAQERTYRESYDKLVLCPGAEPVRPPIPGADDPRVDVLRNIPDMDRIIAPVKVRITALKDYRDTTQGNSASSGKVRGAVIAAHPGSSPSTRLPVGKDVAKSAHQRVTGNCGSGHYIERVHASRHGGRVHGDAYWLVGLVQPPGRQPIAFGAEHQGDALPHRYLVDRGS
jgi:hypothetical protein